MTKRFWLLAFFVLTTGGCNSDDDPNQRGHATGNVGGSGAGGSIASAGSTSAGATAKWGGSSGSDDAGGAGSGPTLQGSANVIDVEVTGTSGAYTFNVTLETTDRDCSHFADWWEVLTPEGELLYRRILAHPHTEGLSGNPFTRSGGPVEIASDQQVVVRAHLSDQGYVATAQSGSPSAGFAVAPDVGSDFASDVETAAPQPGECIPEELIAGG